MEGRSLLVSDLDATPLAVDEALDRFAQRYEAQRARVRLACVTSPVLDSGVGVGGLTARSKRDAVVAGVLHGVQHWLQKRAEALTADV